MFKIHAISFNKILLMELKKITKLVNIIPILLISIVFLFPTILSLNIENRETTMSFAQEIWLSIYFLYPILFSWKILTDVFASENMEKNVIIFLNNNKQIVLISKTISNVIIFTLPILLYFGLQWMVVYIWWHGPVSHYPPMGMRVFISWMANISLYTLISLSIQLIFALKIKGWVKKIISISILFILILFFCILPNSEFKKFGDNFLMLGSSLPYKKWVFYIPIINLQIAGAIFTENFGPSIPVKYLLPFIFETFAMIAIIWFFMTQKIKEYLCT